MNDCIFCKIINGEIPCFKIYEDENFIAFLDRFPCAIGHTLVLPKNHIEDIFSDDLTEEIVGNLFAVTAVIAARIKEVLAPSGINILQNNGEAAGQTVMHMHVHIIPRYENDKIRIGGKPINTAAEELEGLMNKLKLSK